MLFFKELHVRSQSYSVKKKREIGYAGQKEKPLVPFHFISIPVIGVILT